MTRGTFEPHANDRALLVLEHLRMTKEHRLRHPSGQGKLLPTDVERTVALWSDGDADAAVVGSYVNQHLSQLGRSTQTD